MHRSVRCGRPDLHAVNSSNGAPVPIVVCFTRKSPGNNKGGLFGGSVTPPPRPRMLVQAAHRLDGTAESSNSSGDLVFVMDPFGSLEHHDKDF